MDFQQPVSPLGAKMEQQQALMDAASVIIERGDIITVRLHQETTVKRDSFGSIKQRGNPPPTPVELHTFPVLYNPTVKEMEAARIRESVQVLVKTAVLEWESKGVDMTTLGKLDLIRMTVILNGQEYEVKAKQFDSQYGDKFLYVHLGLNKI